jgi:thioredoxin 1
MSIQFTDANFQKEVIDVSAAKPVLVDFFAPWCGPCKLQGPVVDEVSEAMGDIAQVGKMDTDANGQVAGQYGIMSIPTLMVFRNGQVVETMVGLQNKGYLIDVLKKHV